MSLLCDVLVDTPSRAAISSSGLKPLEGPLEGSGPIRTVHWEKVFVWVTQTSWSFMVSGTSSCTLPGGELSSQHVASNPVVSAQENIQLRASWAAPLTPWTETGVSAASYVPSPSWP